MPFCQKLGGNYNEVKVDRIDSFGKNCLSSKQTEYIYKNVELESLINNNTMKEETDQDIELDSMDDNSGDKNLYGEVILNNAGNIENTLSQMEQWSLLNNMVNYVQYSKNPKDFHAMLIKPVNKYMVSIGRKEKDKDEFLLQVDFANTPDRLMEEYLDRYEGVKSEILNTTRFDENSDLSMTGRFCKYSR